MSIPIVNVVSGAFGVVAMVAMTPLITIQILGLMYKIKLRKAEAEVQTEVQVELPVDVVETEIDIFDNTIFELEDGDE